jgi:hypothetical protein
LNCKQIKDLVFRFADNEMEQEMTVAYLRHVDHCPECARYHRRARQILVVLRERVPPTPAPKRLRIRIISALRTPMS